jgi:hypothetical protein
MFMPNHPMQTGGCSLGDNSPVWAELQLLDENLSETVRTIFISDMQCDGDQCSVACNPFYPPCTERHDSPCDDAEAYELVGILRVTDRQGRRELSLEEIDVSASRRLAEGRWLAITAGDVTYNFP